MIRIAIADDHLIIRDGLRVLLEMESDFQIVAEAGTGSEAVSACHEHNPDILLLDLDMPGMDGIEAARALLNGLPAMKIIVLTMHATEEYAIRLLKSGVSGFASKTQSARELPEIIRSVMRGSAYVPADLKETVFGALLTTGRSGASLLTDRELQVFTAYAAGKDRAEIARTLGVSPRTVETHRRNIMQKLNVKNTAELIKAAIREGLAGTF